MPTPFRPVINPILAFKKEPRRDSVTGRSPDEKQVKIDRLDKQRQLLSEQISNIQKTSPHIHNGRALVAVRMFDDSLAPTYEPDAIFKGKSGATLVTPVKQGYLAEVELDKTEKIAEIIKTNEKVDVRVIISRVKSITAVGEKDVIDGRNLQDVWEGAIQSKKGRIFSIWLPPFQDLQARASVSESILDLEKRDILSAVNDLVTVSTESGSDSDQLSISGSPAANSVARAIREYRLSRFTKLQISVSKPSDLHKIAASGSIYRIEPVRPLVANSIPPSPDPDRPILNESWQPIVGVVDGGLFAASYSQMVAWRAPSLVSDVDAHRVHGNHVSSLVIQGSAWNPHLDIPDLHCRVGIAQAIAKNEDGSSTRSHFHSYLKEVVSKYSSTTKVWNFSFNEPANGSDHLEMSELGHEIHKIARQFNILPIISIGNVHARNNKRLHAPGDCEAALTVGGCLPDGSGPGAHCEQCLPGPGPQGLTKPELSWFSTLRGIGGSVDTGSSYATAITSAVAAHTFHNLKNPTPDVVRALLINTASREEHDAKLGWGSPSTNKKVPWQCEDGAVTMIWHANIRAGEWHYWEDIPIPQQFIHNGKLRGRASLTAIISPLVSESGSPSYFSTRLQVALQYNDRHGVAKNLLGSMKSESDIDSDTEKSTENAKWNPVRHHQYNIKNGRDFSGNHLRVCARVYGRNLYLYDIKENSQISARPVAFALTLSAHPDAADRAGIYNAVTSSLGAYVESAVNEIDIEVS